ncbi:MAG: amino acid ABC transporter permease, partial [Rhodoferax sp.]|nr:amino acid ABC transporter permease [Rhodoferax sp.]
MNATIFQPIPARPAPVNTEGPVAWVKANLLGDWKTTLSTLVIGTILLWYVPQILNWTLFSASWLPSYDACRVDGVGACWGVVAEKYRLIIFGRYPFEEQWRPLIATLLLTSLLVASCVRVFWKPWLPLLWLGVLAVFFVLMYGKVMGLTQVDT